MRDRRDRCFYTDKFVCKYTAHKNYSYTTLHAIFDYIGWSIIIKQDGWVTCEQYDFKDCSISCAMMDWSCWYNDFGYKSWLNLNDKTTHNKASKRWHRLYTFCDFLVFVVNSASSNIYQNVTAIWSTTPVLVPYQNLHIEWPS